MRILWLSHQLPWPPKGGLAQRSFHLMRQIGFRHELHIVAFTQLAHQHTDAERLRSIMALEEFAVVHAVHRLPQDTRRLGKIRLAARSLLPGLPYTIRWGMAPEYANSVRATMQQIEPHLVHFDTISLAPYLNQVGDTPAVLNHHNIESHMLARRASLESNFFRRQYFRQEADRLAAYECRVARHFVSHLTCSDLDAERLERNVGPLNTRIVPNGADLEYFTPASEENVEPGSLVFVGDLSWYPNAGAIRYFLREVWPLLRASRPETRLRIIGHGTPADLRRMAALDEQVEFLGFVDDIRHLVHRSHVYICPIRDGGGTKLKMIDAMALGKAIVAHPVACEGLDLTHGVNVMEANSPSAFVEQIVRLCDDHELRRSIERNARTHVENHFSFNVIGADLSTHYESLVFRPDRG